jgi:SAM-dependent methyltransferase
MRSHNPLTRFSDRVEYYIKYRPHYPSEIIDYLKSQNVLKDDAIIADIGSGTGISTEMFLKNGNKVYGVEPNKEMRESAEKLLAGYKYFTSINGTAENTTLTEKSVDMVTAGQAFHWFDIPKAKAEFNRILKPGGYVVLMWNIKQLDTTPFMFAYERMLLEYGTDYVEVKHENLGEDIFNLFYHKGCRIKTFSNEQVFDFEGVKGRLLSSSYAPTEQSSDYKPMIKELNRIFDEHNKAGKITFEYITKVYSGKL